MLQDKKQTDDQNQNILQKFKMPFWPGLQSDECHFQSLRLSMLCYVPSHELYYPFDQSGVAVCWSNQHCEHGSVGSCSYSLPVFQPLHSHTINPTASTHRHFVLISFAHIKRPTEDDCSLNSTISNYDLTENRGLWTVYTFLEPWIWVLKVILDVNPLGNGHITLFLRRSSSVRSGPISIPKKGGGGVGGKSSERASVLQGPVLYFYFALYFWVFNSVEMLLCGEMWWPDDFQVVWVQLECGIWCIQLQTAIDQVH